MLSSSLHFFPSATHRGLHAPHCSLKWFSGAILPHAEVYSISEVNCREYGDHDDELMTIDEALRSCWNEACTHLGLLNYITVTNRWQTSADCGITLMAFASHSAIEYFNSSTSNSISLWATSTQTMAKRDKMLVNDCFISFDFFSDYVNLTRTQRCKSSGS